MSDALRGSSPATRLPLGASEAKRRSIDEEGAADAPAVRPRGRLLRKYVLLFIGLVSLVLLVNSALDFWFSYDENKAALFRIQQEKADSAAQRIDEFVYEFERQLGWTTGAQWAAGPLEQRRSDYFRLLRQAPAITELIQLDESGKEQLKVSRLVVDVVGSENDYSKAPSFTEATKHRVWFSPVYFRKESEPYMTLAMARTGRNAGVTLAEVNLKLILDVITGLKVGKGGYAYVVDRDGRLIAHPDISLVLRNTDLANLPQVAAARVEAPDGQHDSSAVTVATSIGGTSVLTAHAAIAPLGWTVFVELPLTEALAPLYGAALRTAALLALALGLATLAALFLARRMVGPIRLLQTGAARIGAGELDRRIEIHTGDELEGLAGDFNRMAADLQASYADLEKKVEDRTAELKEALDQQTATAQVLGVINSSPGDLAPVFDAMLEKATRLCDASFGILWQFDGEVVRPGALYRVPEAFAEFWRDPMRPTPDSGPGRLMRGENAFAVANLLEFPPYRAGDPMVRALVDRAGARCVMIAPLRKDDVTFGAITIYRQEVRPFSDKEIALLQNFAAQAVIAMENARLITETREALEQQTATAEVLGVINSSPGDLAPVFDAMLERAVRLCEFDFASLWTFDGSAFHPVARHEVPERLWQYLQDHTPPSFAGVLDGERLVHIPDVQMVSAFMETDFARGLRELGLDPPRSLLIVPLRKDDAPLGVIVAYRQEVRPFSDKQIALVQNFAAQAVIAMENARLITETREALEQQTATAEVLQVINSSPGDLAPVFEAILEKAHTLCGAPLGSLVLRDGDQMRAVATRGYPQQYDALARQGFSAIPPFRLLLSGEPFVHAELVHEPAAPDEDDPMRHAAVEIAGIRTALFVPLRKEATVLGYISAQRQEMRPFTDKQIALLQNFAAQAVIAMENARLITETREALEQQTATAEVLQVINSSPGELAPVFDAMLEKAMRLCEAAFGVLWTYSGELFHPTATRNLPPALAAIVQPYAPRPNSGIGRLLRTRQVVNIADMATDPVYLTGDRGPDAIKNLGPTSTVELGGCRSYLAVPLLKDDTLLGAINVYRQEVRPFSDKQIALLQNFAAQAVIAMENARLITETREALEQQTATAEVLGVINSSPGDLAPVFDAMLEKALTLCDAAFGALFIRDGERFHAAATHGLSSRFVEILRQPFTLDPDSTAQRLVRGEAVVHVSDISELPVPGSPQRQELIQLAGARAFLQAALRKDNLLLGIFSIYRQEVRPFSDKQIALLQNFAAQAVIAMENARLITETREALEQQTATAEVLQVINSSPGDLAPVFDVMLERATRLCEAALGQLWIFDGQWFEMVASRGVPPQYAEFLRGPHRPGPGTVHGRLAAGEDVVHIVDIASEEIYRSGDPHRKMTVELGGARSMLAVSLRQDEKLLGGLMIYRQEVRPFSDKEIALVRNFAAQAVIAMENVRLITELRQRTGDLQESLEYQTATSDVLRVISRSGAELEPVLDTLVKTATGICDAEEGVIWRLHGDHYRLIASFGINAEFKDLLTRNPIRVGRGTLAGRTLLDRQAVQIEDAASDPEYTWTEAQHLGRFRTMLGVPLFREDTPIGVLSLVRSRVETFTEKQIALVSTFADQAVIAIENARLFNELRARTAELGRSVDELRLLSEVGQAVSSTLDLRAVLSTILTRSVGLAGADAGAIFRYNRAERAYRLVEEIGWDETLARAIGELRIAETETAMGEAAARRTPVQLPDLASLPRAPLREASLAAGYRGVLIVPLVGPDRILGALVLQRRATGEFPPETVQLMQTLASQSVLAIQNARLFREIADKSEQLALASQHKSQFLANMSHELRTPLNAILGYAELLVDGIYGQLSDRPRGVLERIQNNGRHLLALINDVLDLAKIEAGQLTLTLEDYSLPEVVQSVVTATEPLATGKGLKFTAALQDDLPMAHGDARRVSQVLLNLVGNAIKFTDEGEVEIRAAAEKGQFVLTVRDTGAGIPDADQERIFGEFQQIDNTNTRKQGGTGLGLAISKRMVEMQGGMISVDSVLGQGSTFRVMLPVHVDEVMEAA